MGHLGRRVPENFDHVSKWRFAPPVTATIVNRTLTLPSWHWTHDQGSEGACFPAGTLIEMADGSHKYIEDVRLLDLVRTAEGDEGSVLANFVRHHEGGLITLKLRGHRHLRATSNHPILTKGGYVEMGSLKIGDEVRLPGVLRRSSSLLDTAKYLVEKERRVNVTGTRYVGVRDRGEVTTMITSVPQVINLTPAFGRIVGLWLAEGGTTAQKVTWSFGGHERDTLVADLMELLSSELGCTPRLQVRGNGSLNVIVYGKGWRMLFERMLSHGPYDKSLPDSLADGPRDFLEAVLRGWLDGDGHHRRNIDAGITVSHRLAMSMYRIAQGLGKAPTINLLKPSMNKHAKTRRMRWEVAMAEGQRATVDEGGVWRKVTGLEHEDWVGYVYNLEVEGDHSYVAEGIGVHNCVGHGGSMMMSILNSYQRKAAKTKPYTVRYDSWWLWDRAKEIDPWPDTNPGDDNGTSVSASMDILRTLGHVRQPKTTISGRAVDPSPELAEGIAANRWATNVDEMRTALAAGIPISIGVNWYSNFDKPTGSGREQWIGVGDLGRVRGGHCVCIYGASDRRQAFRVKNSWSRAYPLVWLPYNTMQRLLDEDGESTLVTDR